MNNNQIMSRSYRRIEKLVGISAIVAIFLGWTTPLQAAGADGPKLLVPIWSATPFVILLLCIAVLPLVAGHWWHSNRNKAIVAAACSLPVIILMFAISRETEGASLKKLSGELEEYAAFICLLTALYSIAGGILLSGDLAGKPRTNTAILGIGAVLANFIGTTGAGMILIRPLLRINSERERTSHLPIFFIFIVCNTGGLLTPLGDPPLFLGFLNGVDFFWTLRLWPQWLLVNGLLLTVFYFWDSLAYSRENPRAIQLDIAEIIPLKLRGLTINLPLLGLLLLAVTLQSNKIGQALGGMLGAGDLTLSKTAGDVIFLGLAMLSVILTPKTIREENKFTWEPMAEVAILFVGIFITMTPALALLAQHGGRFGISQPWEFFWLTGGLSAFLDNAPTYVAFAVLAAGGQDIGGLSQTAPQLLSAISCGAVFMGAMTYIGNGPNFMVKAIADQSKYRMPSFGGFLLYSVAILAPIYLLVTAIFF